MYLIKKKHIKNHINCEKPWQKERRRATTTTRWDLKQQPPSKEEHKNHQLNKCKIEWAGKLPPLATSAAEFDDTMTWRYWRLEIVDLFLTFYLQSWKISIIRMVFLCLRMAKPRSKLIFDVLLIIRTSLDFDHRQAPLGQMEASSRRSSKATCSLMQLKERALYLELY
jgi:hypothetical protein